MSRKLLGIALVAAPLLWALSGLPVACVLTSRPPSVEAEEPPTPDVHNVEITTGDGETIGAWWRPPSDSDVAVILLHGHRASRSRNQEPLEWLAEEGHGALSLSVRCHGDSTCNNGYDIGFSARHDVAAAIDWLNGHAPELRVFVWGRSMGAGSALVAAPHLGDRVSGWILESPYADLETAVRNRLRMRLGPLGAFAYPPLEWWGELFLPVPLDEVAPAAAAAQVTGGRFLVVGGTADRRATIEEVRAVCAALGPACRLVELEGGRHSHLWRGFADQYQQAVRDMLR